VKASSTRKLERLLDDLALALADSGPDRLQVRGIEHGQWTACRHVWRHLMINVVLALSYAVVGSLLPRPGIARGAIYSIAPFLMAQFLVMPMMGMPFF